MKREQKTRALLARAYALQEDSAQMLELYDDWAESYDQSLMDHLGYRSPALIAELVAEYAPDRQFRVLDIGCGTGLGGQHLAQAGYRHVSGLDFSLPMLKVARANHCYEHLILADLNQPLPLVHHTLDAIVCLGTFTHSHVGAGCLPGLFKTLRRGGVFVCSVHNAVWGPGRFGEIENQLLSDASIEIVFKLSSRLFVSDDEPNASFIVWRRT